MHLEGMYIMATRFSSDQETSQMYTCLFFVHYLPWCSVSYQHYFHFNISVTNGNSMMIIMICCSTRHLTKQKSYPHEKEGIAIHQHYLTPFQYGLTNDMGRKVLLYNRSSNILTIDRIGQPMIFYQIRFERSLRCELQTHDIMSSQR